MTNTLICLQTPKLIRPEIYRGLPLDSSLRGTPLPFVNAYTVKVRSGLPPIACGGARGTQKNFAPIEAQGYKGVGS